MLAVAHRAGNDLATLRAAALEGADVLEADVHVFRGRLEVRHTKAVGPLLYDQGHWQAARRPLLELDALLDAAPVGATLMLDLKGIGRAGLETARAVHERRPTSPLLVCARWWPAVAPFRDLPWARSLLSARGHVELARLHRRLHQDHAPYGVSVHLSLLDERVVARLRERVELVLTWPVDDAASLELARRVGVGGVITKDLEVLRQVVADRSGLPEPPGVQRG